MKTERGCQLSGVRRLKCYLLMATVGASTDRKTSLEHNIPGNVCKLVVVLGLVTYLIFIWFCNQFPNCSAAELYSAFKKTPLSETNYYSSQPAAVKSSPTNLSHLVFGVMGSVKAVGRRKGYIESWWRANVTRGFVYLDKSPTGELLPWSSGLPPYRVSDPVAENSGRGIRIFHGILEVVSELEDDDDNVRWVVMGDDDTLFFVDNLVDVLAQYDHTNYYYLGGPSEYITANYVFSFEQGFGGAGLIFSYPLAKALANDMVNCLTRNEHGSLYTSDAFTMACIADLGVNLTPQKGLHQLDISGDASGFLSSHPKYPLMSLHHFDVVEPIFPNMSRLESTRHLMKAATADQSRLLQQTVCHYRQSNWSFSVSWGYSAHIYERIMPRSYLQKPIETFKPFIRKRRPRPYYMFNTRQPYNDSCDAPHLFFFNKVNKAPTGILTTYSRAVARGMPPCLLSGNHTADFIYEIRVFSPTTKRKKMERCECCDIVAVDGGKAELKFRECKTNEVIA